MLMRSALAPIEIVEGQYLITTHDRREKIRRETQLMIEKRKAGIQDDE